MENESSQLQQTGSLSDEREPESGWRWRNCRSLAIAIRLWLWPWVFGWHREDDLYGGSLNLFIGPLDLSLHYSIGNCSAEHWWERLGALSETEAFERAARDDD